MRTAPRHSGSAAACAQCSSSTGWVVDRAKLSSRCKRGHAVGAHSAAVDAQRQAGRRGGAQRHAHGGAQPSAAQQHAAQPARPGSASDLVTKSHEIASCARDEFRRSRRYVFLLSETKDVLAGRFSYALMESTQRACRPAAAIAAASFSLRWATSSVASGIDGMQRAAVAAWAREYF